MPMLYEWVDHGGDIHQTIDMPDPCETPLRVRQVMIAEDDFDLSIEDLVGGFRNYGYRVLRETVPELKQERYNELITAMENANYILDHTRGSRTQKLKVLHERMPEPCFGVMM